MDNFSTIVDWDSDFFNKKIAKIVAGNADERYVEEKLCEYKALGFDLVYIFLADGAFLSDNICSSYNCKLVDCRVVYELYVEGEYKLSPLVREYSGEPSQLYDLAFISGTYSRYKTDTNFKDEEFKRLYQRWIENSVNHTMADKVFVFNGKNGIDGFVTASIDSPLSSMGLLATAPERRGNGIGSALIEAVKKYIVEGKAPYLSAATQKGNVLACSFYDRNGFSLKSETNIYHAWLKNK